VRKKKKVEKLEKQVTKTFRTPLIIVNMIKKWDTQKVELASVSDRKKWLKKHGCN